MRKLYEEEIFTRLNPKGQSVFQDLYWKRLFEHFVRESRRQDCPARTGETARVCRHRYSQFAGPAPDAKPSRSQSTEVVKADSPTIILGFKCIHNETKFWHPTEKPDVGIKNRKKKRTQVDSDDASDVGNCDDYALPKGETLNLM